MVRPVHVLAFGVMASLAAASVVRAASLPNLIVLLVDDLGESGIMANNPYIKGPRVSELKDEGVYLSRHYVYKVMCDIGAAWSRPDALNLGFDTMPLRLKRLGYSTHHVGKWHLGFQNASSMLPTSRGFDSFYGYLSGMQDHFSQELNAMVGCKGVVDLTSNGVPAHGRNGTYSGTMYNAEAVAVVRTAEEPFFLNYWMQNTHAPFEVPEEYSSLYNFSDDGLNTFNGMVSVVDEAVGNITDALRGRGVWENTLIVYFHDNGAPLGGGGSNYPLRGGKNSNFEGGVRVPGIVSGGFLPSSAKGTTVGDLVHASDWLPTLLVAATGGPAKPLQDSVSADIPYDGIAQWDAILGKASGTRKEIVLDHCLANFSTSGTGCNHYGVKYAVGAIISGEWKLVKGPNGGEWTSYTNGTKSNSFNDRACDDHCLFNLTADPSEHRDLSLEYPDVLAAMLKRFTDLEKDYHPPSFNPPADDQGLCAAAAAAGNFLTPWTVTPQPGPPVPLGPCIGGAGSPGWAVHNHTGGGGPDIAMYKGFDLSEDSVNRCRQKCCANEHCVSIVLYGGRCFLNPEHGKPAYSRPNAVLAYVHRNPAF